MNDPTLPVLTSCFCLAMLVFGVAALWRSMRGKQENAGQAADPIPALPMAPVVFPGPRPDSPYASPTRLDLPPPLPPMRPAGFFDRIDLFGIAAVFLIFLFLSIGSAMAAGEPEAKLDRETLMASIGLQFMLAGMVVFFVTARVRTAAWLGLSWKGWPWVAVIAPLAVVAMWAVFGLLQALGYTEWMESLGVEAVQDTVKLLQTSQDPWVLALMTVAAVVAAPVCEEIVFRGYLYGAAKRFAGPWAAGLCSALVFGAAHGSLSALLPLVMFGMLLAFIYEKTGSIWAPMAVHFLFNGATVVLQLVARAYELPLDSIK